MPRITQEQWIDFLKVLDELKERVREGWVVVVEGSKDKRALNMLGVEGEILTFTSFAEIADKIGCRKTIILTDFDVRGEEIGKGIVRCLASYGNVPDTEIRKRIFSIVGKEVIHVEALAKFFESCSSVYPLHK